MARNGSIFRHNEEHNMNVQGYTPAMNAPIQAQAASSTATTGASSSSSSSSSSNALSSSDLQSTFLNLLVTELQNQDPTAPVDPTEMVGQMVSLNQLDQLISINQTLTSMLGTATGSATSDTSGSTQAQAAQAGVSAAGAAGASSAAGSAGAVPNPASAMFTPAAANALQPGLNPSSTSGGLMNLYGNMSAPVTNSKFAVPGGR
jgi:flagellar basal-body rod modification protein FlgD